MEDVAREAAVSPITVSRALRTPEKVKAETLERVLAAVRQTGYQVNSLASSLRSGQSNFVTVFTPSLQNLHYAATTQGVIDAFDGSRYQLLFARPGYDEDLGAEKLRALLPFRPAAVVFGGVVRDAGARFFLKSLGVPVVEMWGDVPEPIDMLVSSPGYRGGLLLGEHVARQGYARVAYAGSTGARAAARISGLAAGLARGGSALSMTLSLDADASMEDGIAAFDRALVELPDCDALVFASDVTAAGAMVRATELGVKVPERMGIAGYGDLFFARHAYPGLTTVHNDPYGLGKTAGQKVRARLDGEPAGERSVEMPLHLVARGSTMRS